MTENIKTKIIKIKKDNNNFILKLKEKIKELESLLVQNDSQDLNSLNYEEVKDLYEELLKLTSHFFTNEQFRQQEIRMASISKKV